MFRSASTRPGLRMRPEIPISPQQPSRHASAKELNRMLLSALRKVEKRTTLRAEWVSADGTSERFFDYALKKTIKN
jgi:hypothetical protein